ncbi:MAG: hypothetical protein WBQ21_01390 [Solirubrobacteraceae bacterium]
MNDDPMALLVAANPVPQPPPVDSPEALRRRIEAEAEREQAPGSAERRFVRTGERGRVLGGRVRWVRPAFGGLLLAVLVSVAGVLLSAGSPGPGLNVLAAVYAATMPKPGIVETVTLTRSYSGAGRERTERLREWSDSGLQFKRGLTTVTGSHIPASNPKILDVVYTPRVWEAWSNTRGSSLLPWNGSHQPNTVHRIAWYRSFHPDEQRMGFAGEGLVGEAWAQRFRSLYRAGQMRVVGHQRRGGRSLWKIEEGAAGAKARAREDGTRYYVLVDPHTFLPVYTRLINLALPGDPAIYETELLGYRTLSAGDASQRVFDLAAQHPSSRVLVQPGKSPRRVQKGH